MVSMVFMRICQHAILDIVNLIQSYTWITNSSRAVFSSTLKKAFDNVDHSIPLG